MVERRQITKSMDDVSVDAFPKVTLSFTTFLGFTIEDNTKDSQSISKHSRYRDRIPENQYGDYHCYCPFRISKDLKEPKIILVIKKIDRICNKETTSHLKKLQTIIVLLRPAVVLCNRSRD